MVAGGGAVAVGGGAAACEAEDAIRAVVKVHFVLGMAAAAFALCVATLPPQLKQQGGDCAATAEDAVGMRTDALLLLLLVSAGAQVAAAAVAAFALEACRLGLAWTFAVFAHGLSVRTGIHLFFALATAAGSCPGHLDGHAAYLITDFVLLFIPLCVLFLLGVCALVPW